MADRAVRERKGIGLLVRPVATRRVGRLVRLAKVALLVGILGGACNVLHDIWHVPGYLFKVPGWNGRDFHVPTTVALGVLCIICGALVLGRLLWLRARNHGD